MLSLIRTTRLRDIIDTHQRLAADLSNWSTIVPRLQRVERELIGAKLDRLFGQLHIAIQLTVRQGVRPQRLSEGSPLMARSAAARKRGWPCASSLCVALLGRDLQRRKGARGR